MNNLIDSIRLEQLEARKNKDTVKASLLTTLIGEFESAMKSANQKSEEETLQLLIKKFLKNIEITLAVREVADLIREKEIIESFLPKQLTESELSNIVEKLITDGVVQNNMGAVMKELQLSYKGQYDGKMASQIIMKKINQHESN